MQTSLPTAAHVGWRTLRNAVGLLSAPFSAGACWALRVGWRTPLSRTSLRLASGARDLLNCPWCLINLPGLNQHQLFTRRLVCLPFCFTRRRNAWAVMSVQVRLRVLEFFHYWHRLPLPLPHSRTASYIPATWEDSARVLRQMAVWWSIMQ